MNALWAAVAPGNPVLRGDLRARAASRKLWTLAALYLGILGALVFLGLPPELGRFTESHETSLYVAVLWVQVACITYIASSCLTGEVSVEGEKSPVDLLFAPLSPAAIVAGKSGASLAMIVFGLLLGVPLLGLAAAVRQVAFSALLPACVLVAVVAWATGEIGLLYATLFEGEFTRTLAHWATLIVIFVATAGAGPGLRAFNPFVMTTAAAAGGLPAAPLAAYGMLGVIAALATAARLRSTAAS